MGILQDQERGFAEGLARLTYCNPFLPERIEFEREALGDAYIHSDFVWSVRADSEGERPNIERLRQRAEALAEAVRGRLVEGNRPAQREMELYEDTVLYLLYNQLRERLHEIIIAREKGAPCKRIEFYRDFLKQYEHFLSLPDIRHEPRYTPEHLFASFFQIRRAFHYIFWYIVGGSMPAARLRASVWQSVFTRDMQRYQRVLYDRMGDFTTLIIGPSGTGKELVARAIALSRYLPFDSKTLNFEEDFSSLFHALNLSALSPTLIESELFGHRRGAFTGALEDRAGWLEVCRPLGTVFLDEVGEIDAGIQVKLLRVLQSRAFQRLGDTQTRYFHGKITAATNRDLAREMQNGRIRDDFYYRICSDVITTPSLCEILRESPEELENLVMFIAQRVTERHPAEAQAAGEPGRQSRNGSRKLAQDEAEALAQQVTDWITRNLGREYPWPGNFRELEQCVRNVLIRGEYHPPMRPSGSAVKSLADAVGAGTLTADELLQRYCTLVYSQTRNYEETARRLGLDRRTVKAKIDPAMLEQLKGE